MKRAIFLDRDGVLNRNVPNPANGKWESPYRPEDFHLHAGVPDALRRLQAAGYALIVVTNQPGYAKGTTILENIRAIGAKFDTEMQKSGIKILRVCCCLHHPEGVVPEYAIKCQCRKPSPYFLLESARDFGIDLAQSWIIGDRATDIECGQAAGTRTILIRPDHPDADPQTCAPDYFAANLGDGADFILKYAPASF